MVILYTFYLYLITTEWRVYVRKIYMEWSYNVYTRGQMARTKSGVPMRPFNMNMPQALWDEMDRLLKQGVTPYGNHSAMVNGALDKEIKYLQATKAGQVFKSEE